VPEGLLATRKGPLAVALIRAAHGSTFVSAPVPRCGLGGLDQKINQPVTLPEWQRESVAKAREALESGDFVALPDSSKSMDGR
jgi:hypothetical protein